jgi:hypothetical protein
MHYQSNLPASRLASQWTEPTPPPATPERPAIDLAARWAMVLLIFTASAARIALLDVPFARNHESTATGPMLCAARNLVRYGMIEQRFQGVLNAGEVPRELWVWYSHHPPLVIMVIAWSSEIFGKSEWCYRLPSAAFSVLGTWLIFVLVNRRFGWKTGLAAGVIHAFAPFAWLYANMPDVVGPQMVFFGLATVYSYVRWRETSPQRRWLWAMSISWLLCAASDWSAYFLPPVLALHYILLRDPRQWFRAALRVVPFAVFAALMLATTFAWLLSTPDQTVIGQMFNRIDGTVPAQGHKAANFSLWWQVGVMFHYRITQTPLVLGLIGGYGLVVLGLLLRKRWESLARHDVTIMLIAWGFLHVYVGMQSSIQHMWVWVVLVPGTSMAAALMLRWLWMVVPRRLRLAPVMPYALASVALLFMGYSYLSAKQADEQIFKTSEVCGYPLNEFGRFIRAVTNPTDGVLTSDSSDPVHNDTEPALWFYADRQLRIGIRTVEQLDANLDEGPYRLFYGYKQADGPKPTWFIMPGAHYARFPELAATLDARYEKWLWRDYVMYYLPKGPRPEQLVKYQPATQPAQ